jgi:hypothetical protein
MNDRFAAQTLHDMIEASRAHAERLARAVDDDQPGWSGEAWEVVELLRQADSKSYRLAQSLARAK